MKLAYIVTQYPKVSHTFVRREILALEARGHDVLRIAIRQADAGFVDPGDAAEAERTAYCLTGWGAHLILPLLLTFLQRPLVFLRALSFTLRNPGISWIRRIAYLVEATFILQLVLREAVDHMHVHFGINCASVVRLVRRLGGPTYSMTIHGPAEWDSPMTHAIGPKIEESLFTVAISDYTAAQARRWTEYQHWNRITVVHCAVDERFFEKATPIDDDSKTFVCVGRICKQKGQLILVEAFADLIGHHPDARLVFAGDGEMREELETAIAEAGLTDRVSITGWLDEDAVRTHLLRARCLVLPSFAEGLPVVIMEALALQRPVISTYVAGIPELVQPKENGWLVPAGNRVLLGEAMRQALEIPVERLREMGRKGAECVRRDHEINTEVDKLETLFSTRISAGGGERKSHVDGQTGS